MDIWKKCSRDSETKTIEKEVTAYLIEKQLQNKFSVTNLEDRIYSSTATGIDEIFNTILDEIQGGNLSDLMRFDELFRKKFLSHIPQKALGGLSPIKYAIFLKNMRDG